MNTSKGIGKFFRHRLTIILLCVFIPLALIITWFVWPKSISGVLLLNPDRVTSISVLNPGNGLWSFEISDPEDVKQLMEALNRPKYQPHHLSIGMGGGASISFWDGDTQIGGTTLQRDGKTIRRNWVYYKTSDCLWDDPIFEKYGLVPEQFDE